MGPKGAWLRVCMCTCVGEYTYTRMFNIQLIYEDPNYNRVDTQAKTGNKNILIHILLPEDKKQTTND